MGRNRRCNARAGQTWSADLAISTVLFLAAILITYRLSANMLEETGYEDVRSQSIDAAELIASEGYPAMWSESTVIRAGLVSDGHLSMRKARAMADLDYQDLKRTLRATDELYVYAYNTTHTVPIFDGCGLGGFGVAETPRNRTLPAIAIVRGTPRIAPLTNATAHADDDAYANLTAADVLIIEGNLTSDTGMTPDRARLAIEDAARRGIAIAVIGDPGIGMLGIRTSWSDATSITVEENGTVTSLGLAPGDDIAIGAGPTPIATILDPAGEDVADLTVLARTDVGEIAAATWTFRGAQVWYLATPTGANATVADVGDAIASGIERMITIPWPECGDVVVPASAKQTAHQDRIIADHDRVITVRAIVWRVR